MNEQMQVKTFVFYSVSVNLVDIFSGGEDVGLALYLESQLVAVWRLD